LYTLCGMKKDIMKLPFNPTKYWNHYHYIALLIMIYHSNLYFYLIHSRVFWRFIPECRLSLFCMHLTFSLFHPFINLLKNWPHVPTTVVKVLCHWFWIINLIYPHLKVIDLSYSLYFSEPLKPGAYLTSTRNMQILRANHQVVL